MGDEAGLLGWRIHACVEGLGQCLQIQEQPDQRQFILQALLEVYFRDLVMGGIGLGDQVPGLIL